MYHFTMKPRPHTGWLGIALVLVALSSLLLAPVASVSHAASSAAPVAMADQHHDGCDNHQSAPDDDDCCASAACSCACHAPLLTSMAFPPPPLVIFEQPRETAHRLPLVYQTIFVPPQNRS